MKNSIRDIILKLDNKRGVISDEVKNNTPERIETFYKEIFSGLDEEPRVYLKDRFPIESSDLVIEKNISFFSMCEHHFLPFFGKINIAYIPDGFIVGFGAIIKVIEAYCKRPQLQERLCDEIATTIFEELNCKGVIIIMEAEHICMTMRGVKAIGSKIITTSTKGIFSKDSNLRNEFFNLTR